MEVIAELESSSLFSSPNEQRETRRNIWTRNVIHCWLCWGTLFLFDVSEFNIDVFPTWLWGLYVTNWKTENCANWEIYHAVSWMIRIYFYLLFWGWGGGGENIDSYSSALTYDSFEYTNGHNPETLTVASRLFSLWMIQSLDAWGHLIRFDPEAWLFFFFLLLAVYRR